MHDKSVFGRYCRRLVMATGLVLTVATSGCATLIFPPASHYELTARSDAEGRLTVDVVAPNPDADSGTVWLGWALDLLLGANLPLALATYRTPEDAYLVSALSSLGLLWLDHQVRPAHKVRLPSAVRLEVLDDEGTELANSAIRSLQPGLTSVRLGGRLEPDASINLRLLSDKGERLAEARHSGRPMQGAFATSRPTAHGKRQPPDLSLEAAFRDPERTNMIEAELGGTLEVKVHNSGAPSFGALLTVAASPSLEGLSFTTQHPLGTVAADETRTVRVPLEAATRLPSGLVNLRVGLTDQNGFDAEPVSLRITTQALRLPKLVVSEFAVDNGRDGVIERGQALDVLAKVTNEGKGKARDVRARLVVAPTASPAIVILDEHLDLGLGDLAPGASAIASYSLLVKKTYAGSERLPVEIRLSERHPEVAKVLEQAIVLNKAGGNIKERIVDPILSVSGAVPGGQDSLMADVDAPIDRPVAERPDAIAVVIGVERYVGRGIPEVPFAQRDAAQMREHLEKLVGIPRDNIIYVENEAATKGAIQTALEGDLPTRVTPGLSDVYVYFAGHGAPDPGSKAPYLVPSDGNPSFAKQSCYAMSSFYESLSSLRARSVTVMLDACFSGVSGRSGKAEALLATARPLMIQLKESVLPAGVTVLAAGTGEQVSLGFRRMKHGLFTYYLLKGLRGEAVRDGRLTPSSLASYLEKMVPPEARRQGMVQTPVLLGDGGDRSLR